MVDRISGNSVDNNQLLQVGQNAVEKVNQEAAKEASSTDSLSGFDKATISDEAIKAYEQEKEILKFSRLAQRVQDYDAEKVARMKDLVDSGRIIPAKAGTWQ